MTSKKVLPDRKKLRVAILSTPWISIPPEGYGGIEAVLDGLIKGLKSQDIDMEIFGVAQRSIYGVKVNSLYNKEQYDNIYLRLYDSAPIIAAHMEFAIKKIIEDGNFDIIHDHNGLLCPEILKWASLDDRLPPILHTLHGPKFSPSNRDEEGQPSNLLMWRLIGSPKKLFFVGISKTLAKGAPHEMDGSMLAPVYNAIDLKAYPYQEKKKNYFITLGRFNSDKGQHIAAKYCAKFHYRLRMAGAVADIDTPSKLWLELANPLSKYRNERDFRYYSDKVLPYTIQNPRITYSGNVAGKKKMKFLSEAKALLFPIDWEEPFGMVMIEALACGTPVVAMNRGAVPEIIEHGVNGFIADTEKEFAEYMKRVSEIDPAVCRRTVEERFSADMMATEYIERYREVLRRCNNK